MGKMTVVRSCVVVGKQKQTEPEMSTKELDPDLHFFQYLM